MELIPVALLVAQGVALASLYWKGIARGYPMLVLYLGWSLMRGGVLMIGSAGPASDEYGILFFWTLPVTMTAQVLMASEAYRRSMGEVPGASRLVHYGLLSLSLMAATVVQLGQDDYGGAWVLTRAQQAVATVLGLAAIGIMAWIGYLRPHRRRNSVMHERIVTVHFVGLAILSFFFHRGVYTGALIGALSIICCLAWTTLLSATEQELPPEGGGGPDDIARARQFGRAGRSIWATVRER